MKNPFKKNNKKEQGSDDSFISDISAVVCGVAALLIVTIIGEKFAGPLGDSAWEILTEEGRWPL